MSYLRLHKNFQLKAPNLKSTFLLAIGFALFSCGEEKEKISPERGKMTEAVYASAEIYPVDMFQVYASRPGIVEGIFIDEGDSIFKGQTIAEITSEDVKINSDNARIGVDLARQKLKGKNAVLSSLRSEIKIKEQQVLLDSVNYFRQAKLYEQKIGSKIELEQRKMNYDLSRSQLVSLKINYRQTQLDLQSNYNQNVNALKSANIELGNYSVKSVMDGKVYEVFINPGEFVSTQQPIATVGKVDLFLIELLIDEVDIARVRLGQKGLIKLESYPDQVFEFIITKVYPFKNLKTRSFKVEAQFIKPPEVLLAGMSGEANIIIQEKENCLSIPLNYLFDNNKVLTEDGEIEVKTGIRSLERVEILSGIDENTVLIKPEKVE